jgi:hypothetical protein
MVKTLTQNCKLGESIERGVPVSNLPTELSMNKDLVWFGQRLVLQPNPGF